MSVSRRRWIQSAAGAGVGLGASGVLGALAGPDGGSDDESGGGGQDSLRAARLFTLLIAGTMRPPTGFVMLHDDGAAATPLPEYADMEEIGGRLDLSSVPLFGGLQKEVISFDRLAAESFLAPLYFFNHLLIADLRRRKIETLMALPEILRLMDSMQAPELFASIIGRANATGNPLDRWLGVFTAMAMVFLTRHRAFGDVAYHPETRVQQLGALGSGEWTNYAAQLFFASVVDQRAEPQLDVFQVGEVHVLGDDLVVATGIAR